MKTTKRPQLKELKDIWYIVDAKDKILGRLASKVAIMLIGKDKPDYDPSVPNKVKVVVINAALIKVSGNKLDQKKYYRHTGYMGGLKTTNFSDLIVKDPSEVIRKAVSGMLPKNKLRRLKMDDLKVYADDKHLHIAQKPVKIDL